MLLLDTNVISELRKAPTGRADHHVMAWNAALDPMTLFISAITVLELELGIRRVERHDARQGGALRNWLERRVLTGFAGRILAIDTPVARRCAALHVPDPRPERDAMIAATALVHGLAVATRNTRDFLGTEVALVDPWRERS